MMTVHDHPERTRAVARGDLAERLVNVGLDLAMLVRDEGQDAIDSFLCRLTAGDRYRLLTVLAAMVPVNDMSRADLLSWVTWDEFGATLEGAAPVLPAAQDDDLSTPYEDCGTLKAYYRHLREGTTHAEAEACGCAQAFRDHRAARYAATRGGNVRARPRIGDVTAKRESYARHRTEGLSLDQAAEQVGVSLRTASRYEAQLAEAGLAPWRERSHVA
jgi:hypothetical protein